LWQLRFPWWWLWRSSKLNSTLLDGLTLQPQRWRQYIAPKYLWTSTILHILEGNFLQILDFQNFNTGFYNSYCSLQRNILPPPSGQGGNVLLQNVGNHLPDYVVAIPEDHNIHLHCHESLKSHIYNTIFPFILNDFPSTYVTHVLK
jgi:hypothetical protein